MERNNDAIYYLNKLIALGMEAKRLQDECEEKTGVRFVGIDSVSYDDMHNCFEIQTFQSIDKLGLPVKSITGRKVGINKYVELNGYRVIEG